MKKVSLDWLKKVIKAIRQIQEPGIASTDEAVCELGSEVATAIVAFYMLLNIGSTFADVPQNVLLAIDAVRNRGIDGMVEASGLVGDTVAMAILAFNMIHCLDPAFKSAEATN